MNVKLFEQLDEALRLDGNRHTVGDVFRLVNSGQAQWWENEGAVLVTQVHDAPRASTLSLWLAAGEKDAAVELSRLAIEWGKSQGCTRATLVGRKGWTRVLSSEGWQPSEMVVLERDLTEDAGRR